MKVIVAAGGVGATGRYAAQKEASISPSTGCPGTKIKVPDCRSHLYYHGVSVESRLGNKDQLDGTHVLSSTHTSRSGFGKITLAFWQGQLGVTTLQHAAVTLIVSCVHLFITSYLVAAANMVPIYDHASPYLIINARSKLTPVEFDDANFGPPPLLYNMSKT